MHEAIRINALKEHMYYTNKNTEKFAFRCNYQVNSEVRSQDSAQGKRVNGHIKTKEYGMYATGLKKSYAQIQSTVQTWLLPDPPQSLRKIRGKCNCDHFLIAEQYEDGEPASCFQDKRYLTSNNIKIILIGSGSQLCSESDMF